MSNCRLKVASATFIVFKDELLPLRVNIWIENGSTIQFSPKGDVGNVGKCAISTGIAGSADKIFLTLFYIFTEENRSLYMHRLFNAFCTERINFQ